LPNAGETIQLQSKDAFKLFIQECKVNDDIESMKTLVNFKDKDSGFFDNKKRC
jgi:hypothetical protein